MWRSIWLRQRFAIFERDGFCCQYCWKDPINFDVVLEVDHSISIKDWWCNSEGNLITSCFECNRGKSKKSVILWWDIKVEDSIAKLKKAKERLQQIKKIKEIRTHIEEIQNIIDDENFSFIYRFLSWRSEDLYESMMKAVKWKHKQWVDIELLEECVSITYNKFSSVTRFYTTDFVKYFYWVLRWKQKDLSPNTI